MAIIRDHVKVPGAMKQGMRVILCDSVAEYVEIGIEKTKNIPSFDAKVQQYRETLMYTAVPVLRDGWAEVMEGLKASDRIAEEAFAPRDKTRWDYQGSNLNISRMLQGKPCFSRPTYEFENQPQFVSLVFIAQSMAGMSGERFVESCREMLEFIIACENRGQSVEIILAFGAFDVFKKNSASEGIIDMAWVKKFQNPMDLRQLSALGHPSLFSGAHFCMEAAQENLNTAEFRPGKTRPGYPVSDPETWRMALATILGRESAEGMTMINRMGQMHDLYKSMKGNEENACSGN